MEATLSTSHTRSLQIRFEVFFTSIEMVFRKKAWVGETTSLLLDVRMFQTKHAYRRIVYSSPFTYFSVPSWAMGPGGCLLTELPSLTVLYNPEQSALELTSDCGLDGTKRIACKGNAVRYLFQPLLPLRTTLKKPRHEQTRRISDKKTF